MGKKFSIAARLKSFAYAWSGMKLVFRNEHNMWIHLILAVVAIMLGIFLRITNSEWMALVITITLVVMAELFNTAIEKTMDFISSEKHPQIKQIKDIAAGAVLIAAIAAMVTGCFIFLPKLI